jgi:hypothetical protein
MVASSLARSVEEIALLGLALRCLLLGCAFLAAFCLLSYLPTSNRSPRSQMAQWCLLPSLIVELPRN